MCGVYDDFEVRASAEYDKRKTKLKLVANFDKRTGVVGILTKFHPKAHPT